MYIYDKCWTVIGINVHPAPAVGHNNRQTKQLGFQNWMIIIWSQNVFSLWCVLPVSSALTSGQSALKRHMSNIQYLLLTRRLMHDWVSYDAVWKQVPAYSNYALRIVRICYISNNYIRATCFMTTAYLGLNDYHYQRWCFISWYNCIFPTSYLPLYLAIWLTDDRWIYPKQLHYITMQLIYRVLIMFAVCVTNCG